MIKPIKFSNNGEDFHVYPEYTGLKYTDYQDFAKETGATIIGGTKYPFSQFVDQDNNHIQAILAGYAGDRLTLFGYRGKTHLTSGEKREGFKEANPRDGYPVWDTGKNKILILICYEICFPEDYYHLVDKDIDVIFHLVGYPMYDKNQYKPWYALQKALVKHFNCPVVSSCGGEISDLNLTHVITTDIEIDQIGNFTVKRE